jgi:hypothetical protein
VDSAVGGNRIILLKLTKKAKASEKISGAICPGNFHKRKRRLKKDAAAGM